MKAGDSLSAIAARHLGSARAWREIMKVNPELDKPEHITVGMMLRIPVDMPPETTERATETPANRTEEGSGTSGNTYKVKGGDNLYRIAEKTLGDAERFKEIFEANKDKLASPNDIRPGMVLKLPER